MADQRPSSALVVGDLMLDVVATVDDPVDVDIATVNYADGQVEFQLGGTGLSLARAVRQAGWDPVHLLHSVSDRQGPTHWVSEATLSELSASGISSIANPVSDVGPGIAVIEYLGGGRRMMIGSPGANRAPFAADVLDRACTVVRDCEVLFVSGYMLFRPTTGPALRQVMAAAEGSGVPVVLDVVPHSIGRLISPATFQAALAQVDYVSCELNTLLAVYDHERWPACGRAAARRMVEGLLAQVKGAVVTPEFRHYWIADRDGRFLEGMQEGPAHAVERRGLADRFLAQTVRQHFLAGR